MRYSRPRFGFALSLIVGVPAVAHSQAQRPPAPIEQLRGGFEEVTGWIVRAAELVPESQYGYRPAESVRTLGQLIGHIVDGNAYYCPRAAGAEPAWSDSVANSGATKSQLVARLRSSVSACLAAHQPSNAARIGPLLANYGHASLHYGNLVTYLRMLGLTPPSS